MKQRTRIFYSAQQKELMWERWKKGDTLHDIGKLLQNCTRIEDIDYNQCCPEPSPDPNPPQKEVILIKAP